MKIVWLDINASYSHSSLALPLLCAQAETAEVYAEWEVVSGTIKSSPEELISSVVELQPEVLFASLWLFTHNYMVELIARIKVLCPAMTVILGGPEFLGNNESFLRQHRSIDAVFKGEGDLFAAQWIPIRADRNAWKTIVGLCFIDSNMNYHDGGTCIIEEFAALTDPEKSKFFSTEKAFVQLETSRGCFNRCAFCVSGSGDPVRHQSIEHIQDRLDEMVIRGIRSIRLLDRTFNGRSRRSLELLRLFRHYKGRLTFHLEIHPALLSDEIRNELQTMPIGILHLEAGVQSFCDEVLSNCGRSGTASRTLEGVRFLTTHAERFETHADLIAGLPGYSYEKVLEDVKTLLQTGVGEIQLELLKLLPGTTLRATTDRLKIRYSPFPPYEVLQTPNIDYKSLLRLMALSRFLDYFVNKPLWRPIIETMENVGQLDFDTIACYVYHESPITHSMSDERQGVYLSQMIDQLAIDPPNLLIIRTQLEQCWIKQGLSLHKIPRFSTLLPVKSNENNLKSIRSYELTTVDNRWQVSYERSVSQSIPLVIKQTNIPGVN